MPWYNNPVDDVSICLFSTDNKAFDVVVLDLDSEEREGSVLLDVPRTEDFAVPVGETAVLLFSGVEPERTIQITGTVVFQTETKSAIRYEFKLDEAGTRHLNDLVERREAVRVRPAHDEPVHVTVRSEEGSSRVEAVIRDMSEKGISILVDPSKESLLYSAWKVRLSLRLPGEDRSTDLVGIVRYRRLADAQIQYGIELDKKETPAPAKARFDAYVVSRRNARP